MPRRQKPSPSPASSTPGFLTASLTLAASLTLCPAADKKRWPFYPPVASPPPAITSTDQAANKIDHFIFKKLEPANLTLSPQAPKHTLVRRLYLDLIGLPPSPEQVHAFVTDPSPDAYPKLVDQLLADPRYGERWARFWLDLARYADTAGYEGDPDLPHAWRYRDYVIDSLNRDKPYHQFIKEQIAGDEFSEIMGAGEIPLPDPEKVVAMTFLRLAPFTEPRGDETRHEMLSEMTSTVSSVFLGLTVGCAKCHDHKYDNIPTADFYRMKAFFNTVQIMPPERGDAFQIGGSLPAKFYREGEEAWAGKKRAELQRTQQQLDTLTADLKSRSTRQSTGAGLGLQSTASGNDYVFPRTAINDGKLHAASASSDGNQWIFHTDFETSESLGSLSGSNRGDWFADLKSPTFISIGQHTNGTGNPSGNSHRGTFAEVLIYDRPLAETDHQQLAEYFQKKYRAGSRKVPPKPPTAGLQFWLDASDIDADPKTRNPAKGTTVSAWTDKITGLTLSQDTPDQRPVLDTTGSTNTSTVRFDNDFLKAPLADAAFLENQSGTIVTFLSVDHDHEGYGIEIGGGDRFISTVVNPVADNTQGDLIAWINNPENTTVTPAERDRFNALRQQLPFVKQHLKRLLPQAMSLRHSFGPPYEPGVPTTRVMLRGEHNNPGEVVEAGFLSAITGHQKPAAIRLDPFKRWPTRSRRMTLANWIASRDNPLTARVMMNRLWYHHFGRGIVATPSDFGKLSGGPSHPELLDWLAVRFMDENWSLKAMHRLMVTSNTYRQSSTTTDPIAARLDPDNRLLSRFNRRRIEAEAVRDSVLTASGRLNPEIFGLPIFPPLPGDIAQRVKYNNSKWATDPGPTGRKRSIYIYQQRTLTMPFMQTFDGLVCEDTTPRRQTSITPLQALAMYNSDFVNTEATHFAERIAREAGNDPDSRITHAFAIAFGRQPSPAELADLRPFATDEKKLVGLCRILYNANEFVYVD